MNDRNSLSATTIEAVHCQRNWLVQKGVHSDFEVT